MDGAIKSGRRAAEALIGDTVQEATCEGKTAPTEPETVDESELASALSCYVTRAYMCACVCMYLCGVQLA